MCNQDARNVRAMRKVVKQQTGRKPPKRLKMARALLLVMLLCGNKAPSKPKPRGGRSAKEIERLKKAGAWFRWVFIDIDLHDPDCRWARFWRPFLRGST